MSRLPLAAMILATFFAMLPCIAPAAPASGNEPAWLRAKPGTTARVDIAPWLVSDEPEAALTESAASSARDFTDDADRPGDVHYARIGVVVTIERILPGARVAVVRGGRERWRAYAPLERLVPVVPPGTALVAAGGFGGFASFYKALQTPESAAERVATGTRLVVLAGGVAPYDPDSAGLIRLRVRVANGPWRGRTGWIATGYTGLPVSHLPPGAEVAERACTCRLIGFASARD